MLDLSKEAKKIKDANEQRSKEIDEHRAYWKQVRIDLDLALLEMCAKQTPNNSLEHHSIRLEPHYIGGNSIEKGKIKENNLSLYIFTSGGGYLTELRADFGFEYDVKKKKVKFIDLGKGILWHALYYHENPKPFMEALAQATERWHDMFEWEKEWEEKQKAKSDTPPQKDK